MALNFLQKANANVPDRSLKFKLHSHLRGRDTPRSLERVHASEVTRPEGFCPRYYSLYDSTNVGPQGNWLSTSEQVTFRMGRDLQDSVVHWFADMGLAVGHWQCLSCNIVHEYQKRPYKCNKCACKSFKPVEVRFKSEVTHISGGIDMLASLGSNKLIPVEIKTIDKDEFKALVAPKAEHRIRTTLYLKCIAESNNPLSDQTETSYGKVLYVSKGGYGCSDADLFKWGVNEKFSPFKEYEIKRDDNLVKALEIPVMALKDFRDGKSGRPCGICVSAMAKRAQFCGMKTDCWSGQYPAEVQWPGCAV